MAAIGPLDDPECIRTTQNRPRLSRISSLALSPKCLPLNLATSAAIRPNLRFKLAEFGQNWPNLVPFCSRAFSLSLSSLRLILSTPLLSLLRFRSASILVSSRSFLLVGFFSPSGFFSGDCFGNVFAVLLVVEFFRFFWRVFFGFGFSSFFL